MIRNTFAGSPLDRGGPRRTDEAWLRAQLEHPEATIVALREGRLLVSATSRGGSHSLVCVAPALARADAAAPVFLGVWAEAPVFAIELGDDHGTEGTFEEIRSVALSLRTDEAAIAAAAKSLIEWHQRHRFCAACGRPTTSRNGGWMRKCDGCGVEHFPRVDPVVIMLPTFGDRCLLARQAAWPSGRMAPLAGFVEPGESIEEACARETFEEAGLVVRAVTYHSSQPWPFPSSLMLGLFAEVESDALQLDTTELEEARWLTRDEARSVLAGTHPEVKPPTRLAIGHTLLRVWAR